MELGSEEIVSVQGGAENAFRIGGTRYRLALRDVGTVGMDIIDEGAFGHVPEQRAFLPDFSIDRRILQYSRYFQFADRYR